MVLRLVVLVGLAFSLAACGPSQEEQNAASSLCEIAALETPLLFAMNNPRAQAPLLEKKARAVAALNTSIKRGATQEGIAKAMEELCPHVDANALAY